MGYRHQPRVLRLTFDDYPGLEVAARSVSVGQFLDQFRGATAERATEAELDRLFGDFAGALVEWNLEDEAGEPVPATYEGVKAQELDLMLDIITGWQDAMGSVSGPLAKSSAGGQLSLAGSIPMEVLSTSQAS